MRRKSCWLALPIEVKIISIHQPVRPQIKKFFLVINVVSFFCSCTSMPKTMAGMHQVLEKKLVEDYNGTANGAYIWFLEE